ncbi:MAG: TetR/AcrR family transcriptional regulator [bacterium]|nr:TetR/AcrR family transcriptional regulator [bacterium]
MARKPADQSVHRDDIIVAAADVLRRNGYEATTMKDIAAEVNLTAASLYHHFKNKDTLLLAVLEAGVGHVVQLLEPIATSNRTNPEKLREMIQLHVTSVTRNTSVSAAMVFEIRSLMNFKAPPRNGGHFDAGATDEFIERRDAFFVLRDQFEELFRCVIRDGIATGEFRPVDAAIFVKSMLGAHNWVAVWFRPEGRLSGEEIAGMLADNFLRALRP